MAGSNHAPKNCLLDVSHHTQDEASVDIIAIHGLGTTSPLTWEARRNQACGAQGQVVNWLSDDDMLPRIVPSARILTFTWDSDYYSNAPVVRIRDVADTLLRKLQDKRNEENTHSRPLIFIASCFGGLIVTRALEIASIRGNEYLQLVVATSGVVFLGSPLQGTRAGTAAQWRAMLGGVLNNSPSQTLLQDLDGHTKVLRDTSEQFLKIITAPPMQTMTMCFWESKKSQLAKAVLPTWVSKHLTSTEIILVEEDSACLFGRPKQQLDAPHVMMNKFQGPEDENFRSVSRSIKTMVQEAKRITLAQREAVNIHNEHFMVSRRVNPVFTGREKEIKDLQQSLCPSHSTHLQAIGSKIYVIHGLGGAGKSEVALNFAYDNRAEFWGVFWLDASSESSLTRGFVDVAEKCDLREKSLEGARLWLQETPHSWLLVLDNADDPKLDYAFYLPSASKGHILITSRVPACADLQTAGTDFYERLDETTAIELLLKASKISSNLDGTHDVDAREIVNLLGCHALAVIQAGASISQGICELGEYVAMFKKQRQRLFEIRPGMAKSQYGDVYATFEVSATYLSDRSDQAAIDALALLRCYAFLNFTDFPEKTFEEAWQNSRDIPRDLLPGVQEDIEDLSHWHVRHLPNFMRQDSSGDLDNISLRKARNLLASLSIVVFDLPTRMTRMHPVTHMWARDRLKDHEEATDAWLATLTILSLSIKHPWSYEAWWAQLQPHIEFVTMYIPDEYLHHGTFSLHQSFYRLAWVLHRVRADKALLEMLQKCFINADQSWTNLPYCHYIQRLYGICLDSYGDFEKAKQWLEQVVQILEKVLDPEDHNLLSSKHALAGVYTSTGDIHKAKYLLEEVVDIEAKILDLKDSSLLASQHELAKVYSDLEENEKAKDLLEQVVKIQAETLRPEHPDRLASQHVLAKVYLALKENDKAKDLLEQVVETKAETLRPENPDRLASQHELARVYLALKENDKAKDLLEQVVKIRVETLRSEHPHRLISQHELAGVYLALKENEKAKDLLEQVVKTKAETLRPEDPERLKSKHELARAYLALGETIKARDQIEEVVRIQEKTLSPEHPNRLASKHILAEAYLATGETIKARNQVKEVVMIEAKTLSSDDPDRLVSMKLLEECEEKLRLDEID